MEDRTNGGGVAQALNELVANVAHFQARHYKHIGVAGNGTAGRLALTHCGNERCVGLEFAVNQERRIKLLGKTQSLYHLVYIFVLGRAF